jgi:glutamate dehydrogenase (NADP+)
MSLFNQTVLKTSNSLKPLFISNVKYKKSFDLLKVPEKIISFRVLWEDDNKNMRINTGYRVQHNSTLGPYKGGIRFNKNVTVDTMKFLAYEQTLKNSLTGLQLGGAKGGSDFDPSDKSISEIRRFCFSFMDGLYNYIGPETDIPAGDIGVGQREVDLMYGRYKLLSNKQEGSMTGKSIDNGGSLLRLESTGYGCVYFLDNMLKDNNDSIVNKNIILTGYGNVSRYTAEKILELGGNVISFSDSKGSFIFNDKLTKDDLNLIKTLDPTKDDIQNINLDGIYYKNKKPWNIIDSDIIITCATQNEMCQNDIKYILKSSNKYIIEASNMGIDNNCIDILKKNNIIFAPSKAVNLGGVTVSGLEMVQNSQKIKWNEKEIDLFLKNTMLNTYNNCIDTSLKYLNKKDILIGSDICAFLKISNVLEKQGLIY